MKPEKKTVTIWTCGTDQHWHRSQSDAQDCIDAQNERKKMAEEIVDARIAGMKWTDISEKFEMSVASARALAGIASTPMPRRVKRTEEDFVKAHEMQLSGATLKKIGEALGVSGQRARQMAARGGRIMAKRRP